jgi:hypothetical protein
MATDDRKDIDRETAPEIKKDENLKDLSAKKLDEEKEGQVKGGFGGIRPEMDQA